MKVIVLMGGDSAEREVSLSSGRGIANALIKRGHQVKLIDTADLSSHFELTGSNNQQLAISSQQLAIGNSQSTVSSQQLAVINYQSSIINQGADVVFLALHGGSGENGTIQALLDLLKIPYTGSGVLASALAMDKSIAKTIFAQNNIRTPKWFTLSVKEIEKDFPNFQNLENLTERINNNFGFPMVVKPNDQGSTVGLSIVDSEKYLEEAIKIASQYSKEILFEQYIPGRELTVAILDGEALPIVEIIPEHGIYDYECKYTKGKSQYVVPAEIPESVTNETQDLAKRAFKALKCRGVARIDFRLNPDNIPYCLEVNTLPGMTETSLVPKSAKAIGMSYEDLVEKMIQLAISNY